MASLAGSYYLVSTVAFCVISMVIGVRLASLSRRTGARPELYLGAGLFLSGGIGYALVIGSAIAGARLGPERAVVHLVGLAGLGVHHVGVAFSLAFVVKVFRPTERWAPAARRRARRRPRGELARPPRVRRHAAPGRRQRVVLDRLRGDGDLPVLDHDRVAALLGAHAAPPHARPRRPARHESLRAVRRRPRCSRRPRSGPPRFPASSGSRRPIRCGSLRSRSRSPRRSASGRSRPTGSPSSRPAGTPAAWRRPRPRSPPPGEAGSSPSRERPISAGAGVPTRCWRSPGRSTWSRRAPPRSARSPRPTDGRGRVAAHRPPGSSRRGHRDSPRRTGHAVGTGSAGLPRPGRPAFPAHRWPAGLIRPRRDERSESFTQPAWSCHGSPPWPDRGTPWLPATVNRTRSSAW